jgi:enterochelin esterase-like enzyme
MRRLPLISFGRVVVFVVLLQYLPALKAQNQAGFKSVEFAQDGSITFRFEEPAASKVALVLENRPDRVPMHKVASGRWEVTLPALSPEIYGYRFAVDGRPTTRRDPQNPNARYANSLLSVPGNPPQLWEVMNVQHGTVTRHSYTTRFVVGLDQNRSDFVVYTPPSYDPHAKNAYPVLYLLHCWGDRPDSWDKFAQANIIFDNLIALGKIKPVVVVMPLGYGDMKFAFDYSLWEHPDAVDRNVSLFSQALLTEVMPQVEHLYRVSTKRTDRAIIGASMGGLESLSIGLNNTSQFAWIGGISSALDSLNYAKNLPAFNPKTADLGILWIACGTGDDFIGSNRRLAAWLRENKVPVITHETSGMHTYIYWRESLIQFASMIFKTK